MKTKGRKLVFSAVAALALAAFFQIETSKADVLVADSCEYTGNPNDYCVFGNFEVYNCVRNSEYTSCGILIEEIEE